MIDYENLASISPQFSAGCWTPLGVTTAFSTISQLTNLAVNRVLETDSNDKLIISILEGFPKDFILYCFEEDIEMGYAIMAIDINTTKDFAAQILLHFLYRYKLSTDIYKPDTGEKVLSISFY